MQKTYWWRICLSSLSLIVLVASYVGPCGFNFNKCLGGNSILTTRTAFHIFLATFLISFFLFFVKDIVFLKWLKFAIAWVALTIVFVALAPVYTGGWMSFGPTKESVSIWMGSLFVILSLAQLVWQSRKQQ